VIVPETTQEQVYATVAQPLVHRWLEGWDVDLISYGQTGSGKTFTMFGPPFSMERAAASLGGAGTDISGDGIVLPEHGFILRSGLEALQAVASINSGGAAKAVLHGSMVEMSIMNLSDQSVIDLINGRKRCFVDKQHHLQGAVMVPLRTAAEVVHMAAAVETRLVRGTKMNDTSSRSHCWAVFTLTVAEGEMFRTSRLQFFDLMGSERFKGENTAHNEKASTKSTMGGWEGIFANLSLSGLLSAVDSAAIQRRRGSNKKYANPMLDMVLTDLLAGSLQGSAITGMVSCLSQSPRNGGESFLTL
jgi:kinesin family protein 15